MLLLQLLLPLLLEVEEQCALVKDLAHNVSGHHMAGAEGVIHHFALHWIQQAQGLVDGVSLSAHKAKDRSCCGEC